MSDAPTARPGGDPTGSAPEEPLGLVIPGVVGLTALAVSFGAGLATPVVAPWRRIYAELGVALPVPVELVLALGLPGTAYAWGLLAAGLGVAAGRVKQRKVGVALLAATAGVSALLLLGVTVAVVHSLRVLVDAVEEPGAPPTPPPSAARMTQVAELAEEVAAAVRRDVARARTFRTPGGAERRFFVYTGPGAPAARQGDYGALHAEPACVLLPAAPPSGPELETWGPRFADDLSPAALDAGAEAEVMDTSKSLAPVEGRHGEMALRVRRVFRAGDLAYAFVLRRGRVQDHDDRSVRSDRLFLLQVVVFDGFDDAQARGATLPRGNVPVFTAATEVRP